MAFCKTMWTSDSLTWIDLQTISQQTFYEQAYHATQWFSNFNHIHLILRCAIAANVIDYVYTLLLSHGPRAIDIHRGEMHIHRQHAN